jgi:hypothetical protein
VNQNQSQAIHADKTVTFALTGAGDDGSGSSGSSSGSSGSGSGDPASPVTSLHYAPNADLAYGSYNAAGDPGSDGFNLADVGSAAAANSLPSGVEGLIWLGATSGLTSSVEQTINAAAGDSKVYGFYVADEPSDSDLANVKAVDDYIAEHAPGKMSFIVAENDGTPENPVYAATPQTTDANLVGLDPYPVRPQFSGGIDLSVIDTGVHQAEAIGWALSQIVSVYQAFGGGGYSSWTLPTATQEQQILAEWGKLTPKPAFDYAYSWGTQDGDSALTNTPSLQAVFAQHN